MSRTALIVGPVMALFFVGNVLAQSSIGNDTLSVPTPGAYAPSMLGLIAKLVISMALIVGLIYLSTYFLKKMNSRSSGGGTAGDIIKVIGRTYIAPKQCLYIIRIGERYSVLGATDININFITELKKEEVDKFDKPGARAPETSSLARFSEILKGKMRS